MRRTAGIGLLGAALALAACGGGDGESAQAASPQAGGGRPGGGPRGPGGPTPVEVVPVERGSIAQSVTVSGVVEPIRTVGVNSLLSGAVLSIHAEEGAVVAEGAVLARMDDRELQAQLAAAEASFQVAEAAWQRSERLRERQVITLPEYERDRTAYAAATAQLEQVRTRIGYATVQAPIRGVVTEKRVEAGDIVAPQTRLFTLADLSTIVVRVGVSELDVVELGVGDPVSVGLDAFGGRDLSGRIRRIFPSADPTTRLVPVEVALEGEAARLARPGFLARTTFALAGHDGVLLVPASAIVGGTGSSSVFVVEDGRAVRRTVTTGLTSLGRVEVVDGLTGAEQVVTAGNNQLRDGAQVRVMPAGGEEGPMPGDTSARSGS